LQKYGVQLVITGHEHYYEHNVLKYDNAGKQRQMHILVSGGGGVPLRALVNEKKVARYISELINEGLNFELNVRAQIYHYCLIEVEREKILIKVMEVTGNKKEPIRLADEIHIKKGE